MASLALLVQQSNDVHDIMLDNDESDLLIYLLLV